MSHSPMPLLVAFDILCSLILTTHPRMLCVHTGTPNSKSVYLVLPLTVEPTKPRLCVDARFLNLWMRDSPFKLDKLVDVTRYVYKNSLMTKCDDKSGYDHVLLQEQSQQYFGICWKNWWFVCTTLPFGWKLSPFIYHMLGAAVSGYFRSIGIP